MGMSSIMDLSKSEEYFNPSKYSAQIHIVGCGSVGSTVAENLARCGITKFNLWDFDYVEPHNVANQMFRQCDIGKPKVEALVDILSEINPEIRKTAKVMPKGWDGQTLSGYIFLCVDDIELRKKIATANKNNLYVKAMFDFRTRLEDAQHYAADWSDIEQKDNFIKSMNFSNDEAKEATPVSACNVTLSVCPTIRIICAYGVANFMNFWTNGKIKNVILINAFNFSTVSF